MLLQSYAYFSKGLIVMFIERLFYQTLVRGKLGYVALRACKYYLTKYSYNTILYLGLPTHLQGGHASYHNSCMEMTLDSLNTSIVRWSTFKVYKTIFIFGYLGMYTVKEDERRYFHSQLR